MLSIALLPVLAVPLLPQATCVEMAQLEPSPEATASYFGSQIGLHNGKAIVGAPLSDGGAFVFRKQGEDWTLEAELSNPTAAHTSAGYGFGVSISLPYAMVGAPADDTLNVNMGAVTVYLRGETGWVQTSGCSRIRASRAPRLAARSRSRGARR
jgi:hypothetical protein